MSTDRERAIAIQKEKKAKKAPKEGAGPPSAEQLAALRAQKALLKQQKEECEARGETWVPPAAPDAAPAPSVAAKPSTPEKAAPSASSSAGLASPTPPPAGDSAPKPALNKQSAAGLAAEANKSQKLKNQQRDAQPAKSGGGKDKQATGPSRMQLFDHLPKKEEMKSSHYIEPTYVHSLSRPGGGSKGPEYPIHAATTKLGVYFRRGLVRDDDDRIVALISALKTMVSDYVTPPKKSLAWDLDKYISAQVQYLINCRQHSIGMGNLIKYLRYTISQIAPDCSEDRAKTTVTSALTEYLAERIINSRNCISQDVCFPSIKEHDVILTFGSSPLVRQILLETAARGRRFRVIIVDARPLHDGRATMQACAAANIPCMYTNLAGVNFVMDQATRVLMGASAVLSNGAVLAPAGTAMIASIARAHRVPTMFAAESYKFSFKVQLDSVVYNELGNIDEIATPMEAVTGAGGNGNGSGAGGSGSAAATAAAESEEGASDLVDAEGNIVPAFSRPQTDGVYRGAAEGDKGPGARLPYSVINLRYDLTPICNVSVVATESGLIPPTSIPILIKEYNKQQGHGAGATSAAAAMNVA